MPDSVWFAGSSHWWNNSVYRLIRVKSFDSGLNFKFLQSRVLHNFDLSSDLSSDISSDLTKSSGLDDQFEKSSQIYLWI